MSPPPLSSLPVPRPVLLLLPPPPLCFRPVPPGCNTYQVACGPFMSQRCLTTEELMTRAKQLRAPPLIAFARYGPSSHAFKFK